MSIGFLKNFEKRQKNKGKFLHFPKIMRSQRKILRSLDCATHTDTEQQTPKAVLPYLSAVNSAFLIDLFFQCLQ